MNASDIQQRIAEAADKQLLEWLETGITEFTGQLDASGNPIMVKKQLSATHMAQVLKRIGQLKLAAIPVPGSPAGNLLAKAEARGLVSGAVKFNGKTIPTTPPPLSDDDDAATR